MSPLCAASPPKYVTPVSGNQFATPPVDQARKRLSTASPRLRAHVTVADAETDTPNPDPASVPDAVTVNAIAPRPDALYVHTDVCAPPGTSVTGPGGTGPPSGTT